MPTFRIIAEVTADDRVDAVDAADHAESAMERYGYEASVWVDSGSSQEELQTLRARIAELEALVGQKDEPTDTPYNSRPLPPRDAICTRTGCGHPGSDHHHGDTKCWAHPPKELGDPVKVCDCSTFETP